MRTNCCNSTRFFSREFNRASYGTRQPNTGHCTEQYWMRLGESGKILQVTSRSRDC
ncbi:hypothetical protein CsSME_00043625 [Camellia sinensis var. sinensis]